MFLVGAVRPGLHYDKGGHAGNNDAYYIATHEGGLWGNGKGVPSYPDASSGCVEGDRIGVLLDLDAGWLSFYRNGEQWGPGFTEGVEGPLV
jgi:hypothetical protein